MKKQQSGFTLVEVLIASFLACITLTCIIQFFLTQLNQYRYISSNNTLNENVRVFSKFLEKDVHNSLSFHMFNDLDEALTFQDGMVRLYLPVGDCVLFVQERGMVEGGRGVIYHIGKKTTLNGQTCYPLYRALVTFSANKKINETADNLINLTVGYLPILADSNLWYKGFTVTNSTGKFCTGIFYTNIRKRADSSDTSNVLITKPFIAGCRHGLFVRTRFIQPGFHGIKAETICNVCFFSRNPKF